MSTNIHPALAETLPLQAAEPFAASADHLVLAVVLPTFNEKDNVLSMIERLEDSLGPHGWEAIFVDDDSPDGTSDVVRQVAQRDRRIRLLHRFGRRGLASAAIEGMCATSAPYVALIDADHQHDPRLLLRMLDAVRSGEGDIAIASRFADGASAAGLSSIGRVRQSKLANRVAGWLVRSDLSDAMSGYFLMRSEQLRSQANELSGIGFKILLDILGTANPALKIVELPLRFADRRAGESKLDRAIAFQFLAGLYERHLGHLLPTRFALFGTVGALGVGVHFFVLSLIFLLLGAQFLVAQTVATIAAMSFNFWLNNFLTFQDQRLKGARAVLRGWLWFCATCSLGAFANIAVAEYIVSRGGPWALAALAGIFVGSVWNYALSSRFVWGRF